MRQEGKEDVKMLCDAETGKIYPPTSVMFDGALWISVGGTMEPKKIPEIIVESKGYSTIFKPVCSTKEQEHGNGKPQD